MGRIPPWADGHEVDAEPAEQREPPAKLLSFDRDTLEELALSRDAFLLYPLIASEGVSALAAETGTGKSGLVLDVAMHLVFGFPDWHGELIDTPKPRRVLLIDGENSLRIVARRCIGWLRHYGLYDEASLEHLSRHLIYAYDPRFLLGMPQPEMDAAYRWLGGQLMMADRDAEQFELVILDNLMSLMRDGDVNDSALVGAVLRECEALARDWDVRVLLEAHPPKNIDASRNAMLKGRRPGRTSLISGSQRSVNSLDSACLLVEGDNENERVLGQGKVRDGAPMDRVIWFRYGDQALDVGPDGGGTSLAIERMEVEAQDGESDMQRFAAWLRDEGYTSFNAGAKKSDMTMRKGCPFGTLRAMNLATKPELKMERFECGVMAEQKVGPKGGSASWRVWWVDGDAPFNPELDEEEE